MMFLLLLWKSEVCVHMHDVSSSTLMGCLVLPDVVQLVSVMENNVFGLSVEGPAASAESTCHRAGRRPPCHALRSEI